MMMENTMLHGWISDDPNIILLDNETIWEIKSKELTENTLVIVTWNDKKW